MARKQHTMTEAQREMREFIATAPLDDVRAMLEQMGAAFTFSGICFWFSDKATAHECGARYVNHGRHARMWYVRRAA